MKTNNGWSVDPPTTTIRAGGLSTAVRRGDVAVVLQYVAARFFRSVEKPVSLHGYRSLATNAAVGGDTASTGAGLSNHVSGTAIDLNGAQHPYEAGRGTLDEGFTAKETKAVRKILGAKRLDGIVQWGMDYPKGWRDGMHFQIRPGTSAAQVKKAAKALNLARPLGRHTIRRWQKALGTHKDGKISVPTSSLIATVQERINHEARKGYIRLRKGPLEVTGTLATRDVKALQKLLNHWRRDDRFKLGKHKLKKTGRLNKRTRRALRRSIKHNCWE